MKPMTHRERFLHNRWLERRARKIKAARLAKQAKQIDPKAKPSIGWWPGMYEGAPRPKVSQYKLPHYQEQAFKSVGYQKSVTANPPPTHQPVRKSERRNPFTAPPVGAKKHTQLQRDQTNGEHGFKPLSPPDFVRSEIGSITSDRENYALSADLSASHKEAGKTEFRVPVTS